MTRGATLLFVAVLVFSAGCDHATKRVAEEILTDSPVVSLVGDAIRFELARNPGGFLSLGARLPSGLRSFFFVGMVPLLILLVCVLALRADPRSRRSLIGVGMIAGGGLANWIDRMLNGGAVTDFVSVGLGPLRTGIFNLADLCVLAGVALLALGRSGDKTAA
jgi:signal peptidase II